MKRSDPTAAAIAAAVTELLLEISGTLNAVITALGLSKSSFFCVLWTYRFSLHFLWERTRYYEVSGFETDFLYSGAALVIAAPLTAALSLLLSVLGLVVNGLLTLVTGLLDGLLLGLSAALAGLLL